MAEKEMLVELVIPDNVAVTALRTLREMGLQIDGLKREDYYYFEFEGDEEEFKKKASQIDILVNTNKHKSHFRDPSQAFDDGDIHILVRNRGEKNEHLIRTLQHLGLGITAVSKGVAWTLKGANEETARKAAEELLCNKHYQDYLVL